VRGAVRRALHAPEAPPKMQVLPYEPLRCRSCRAALNPSRASTSWQDLGLPLLLPGTHAGDATSNTRPLELKAGRMRWQARTLAPVQGIAGLLSGPRPPLSCSFT